MPSPTKMLQESGRDYSRLGSLASRPLSVGAEGGWGLYLMGASRNGRGCAEGFFDSGDAEIEGVGLHFEDARHAGEEAEVFEVGGCTTRRVSDIACYFTKTGCDFRRKSAT